MDLERRLIIWLFTVVVGALVWMRRIDADLEHLLERVSPCGLSCLVAYDPAAWVSIKWTGVALASIICTLPLLVVLLDRFASPGLLPSERRAWRLRHLRARVVREPARGRAAAGRGRRLRQRVYGRGAAQLVHGQERDVRGDRERAAG